MPGAASQLAVGRDPMSPYATRLAATPHPLFLQRTLVSRKRAKIGARAGPIWHYAALRGTRRPLHVRVHARSKDLWDRHVVPSSPAPARRPRTTAAILPPELAQFDLQAGRLEERRKLRVGELQWTPEDGECAAKNGTKRGDRQCGCTSSFRRASGTSPVADHGDRPAESGRGARLVPHRSSSNQCRRP